jgi:hypothetical protein
MSSPKGTNGALVTINLAPVNDAPIAVAQSVTTLEDTAVTIALSGTDADTNSVVASIVASPTNGTYNLGTATYTPNANFFGRRHHHLPCERRCAQLGRRSRHHPVVNPVNDAPVMGAVAVAGTEDTTVSFTSALFTTQYSDLESDPFTSLTVTTLPATGSLKLAGAPVTAGSGDSGGQPRWLDLHAGLERKRSQDLHGACIRRQCVVGADDGDGGAGWRERRPWRWPRCPRA